MTTMQQAVHIFKKDVRFLRMEIAVMAVVAVIFAWSAFRIHAGFAIPDNSPADVIDNRGSVFPQLMTLLMYTAAILLTVRAIQTDPIPGSREFWLTRPYRWKSVLMAKAMFIVVC